MFLRANLILTPLYPPALLRLRPGSAALLAYVRSLEILNLINPSPAACCCCFFRCTCSGPGRRSTCWRSCLLASLLLACWTAQRSLGARASHYTWMWRPASQRTWQVCKGGCGYVVTCFACCCKELGGRGEPLYLDVAASISEDMAGAAL